MTDRGYEVLHHLIRQTGIVVMAGGLIVALVLKALTEPTFTVLFGGVVAGKVIEHFRERPDSSRKKEGA